MFDFGSRLGLQIGSIFQLVFIIFFEKLAFGVGHPSNSKVLAILLFFPKQGALADVGVLMESV